jgi:lipid II isoglutaminyl synthase (glutamine-hydrolysing)
MAAGRGTAVEARGPAARPAAAAPRAVRGAGHGPARARAADRAVARLARLVGATIRATGRGQGATLPGLLAERCAPGITRRSAARLERVVLVSGTNGKTTTTAMLAAALAGDGRRVVSNGAGSNLHRGLTTALLGAGAAAQDAVLEVDEAVLPRAIEELRPEAVVLLNLTRDQLDRHHEVGGLAERWRQGVAALPTGATVVANAGDPRTAWVAGAAPRALLVRLLGGRLGRDGAGCPRCGALLGQARSGRYACGRCGWSPPPASVEVERERQQLRLRGFGGRRSARLQVTADGYALDAAISWAAAVWLGASPGGSLARIAALGSVQDRYALRSWHGTPVRLLLAKNPAGWDEALGAASDRARAAVVAVNAGEPDGRDTSWLWDVDMARLGGRPLVVATGERAEDAALRLEVAGVPCRVVRPLGRAIAVAGDPAGGGVDLFADYTSFRQARRLLGRRG